LAIVDAAQLRPLKQNSGISSANGWMHARLSGIKTVLMDHDWAGYFHPDTEIERAKPSAAVGLAQRAIMPLDLVQHTLTEKERSWASIKFDRDWNRFKNSQSHWWVRYRAIQTIGVVGNFSALLTLRGILEDNSAEFAVYYAINAITRLTKTDVRDQPVQEMDLEKTRRRVLAMLREKTQTQVKLGVARLAVESCQAVAEPMPACVLQTTASPVTRWGIFSFGRLRVRR
jgi:hypothetical protein